MNRLYTIFAVVFCMFQGGVSHGMFSRDRFPESATIDENNASDVALVRAFGRKDKAALWKELGVHFKKGEVRVFTSSDDYKYRRTNDELIENPDSDLSMKNAEALMYFLFPRIDNKSMSGDEINKILDISEERMKVIKSRWNRLQLWATPPRRHVPRSIYVGENTNS